MLNENKLKPLNQANPKPPQSHMCVSQFQKQPLCSIKCYNMMTLKTTYFRSLMAYFSSKNNKQQTAYSITEDCQISCLDYNLQITKSSSKSAY